MIVYPSKPKEITIGNLFKELSENPNWCCEPKWNGWRCLLNSEGKEIYAYNHNGEELSYFTSTGIQIPENCELDCEWVDRRTTTKNLLIVFGILKYDNEVLEGKEEKETRKILENIFKQNKIKSKDIEIKLVDRFYSKFQEHFNNLKNDDTIEGLVLKNTSTGLEISYQKKFKTFNQLKVKK